MTIKVLSCKVPYTIYQRVSALGPKSVVLRDAIESYLHQHENHSVDHSIPDNVSIRGDNEYHYIESELKSLIDCFCKDLKKLMEAKNEGRI